MQQLVCLVWSITDLPVFDMCDDYCTASTDRETLRQRSTLLLANHSDRHTSPHVRWGYLRVQVRTSCQTDNALQHET